MRLLKLSIRGYKNLQSTQVVFGQQDAVTAIVGNNGTGKSNLIEAILHIFMGLYYAESPDFAFEIEYESHNKRVLARSNGAGFPLEISIDGHSFSPSRFKQRVRDPKLMPPFPALVLGYYSGTCERLDRQLRRYQRSYAAKLRRQTDDLEQQFVSSNIDQAEWVLVALVAHGRSSLLNELSLGDEIEFSLTLRSPTDYDPEIHEPTTWNLKAGLREFVASLDACSDEFRSISKIERDIDEDTAVEEIVYEDRKYVFGRRELGELAKRLDKREATVYSMLQALHAKKLLIDFRSTVVSNSAKQALQFDHLSEGEKQLICVLGALTLSNQQECLVLLDEPDTHLNPNWSTRYTQMLREALTFNQQNNSTVLLATHDPMLISDLPREQVLVADIQEGGHLRYRKPTNSPQGMGVAGILTSDMFGLMTTLDHRTQALIRERREVAANEQLSDDQKARLKELNSELDALGYGFIHPDEDYRQFLIARHEVLSEEHMSEPTNVEQRVSLIKSILKQQGFAE